MGILNELLERAQDDHFDANDVLSKVRNAEKTSKNKEDSVGFGLEELDKDTGESRMIKVFVAKDQADDFEKALAAALDEFNGQKEVAEILFDLRNRFDIVNVEWPSIPEDEEVDQQLAGDQTANIGGDVQDATGQDMTTGDQVEEVPPTDDGEESAKTTLQAVIDMMKSDAEARKADAEARKAEADARNSEHAAQAANANVKRQEEVMDMEAYYKDKETQKKETDMISKLAKYRHDKAQDSEKNIGSIPTEQNPEDEEEQVTSEINPDANKDHYIDDGEYLAYIEKFLKNNKAQR